jgi:hypothetical protein
MGLGSGLGASFGLSDESSYGVYSVASIRFWRAFKASIKPNKNVVEAGAFAAGQLVAIGGGRVVSTTDASGGLEIPVTTTKMGLILKHIFGTAATPVQQGATAAYLQTYVLADRAGKSFTGQIGLPQRGGTVTPQSGTGGKIMSAEFTCSADDVLRLVLEIDYQGATTSQTLATVTYVSGSPFSFKQMAVKLGTYGSEAAVTGVKSVSVKFEFPSDDDAYYAGAAGLKAEQIQNDQVKITGSMETDFINPADFYDRYVADTSTAFVVEWIGSLIASTFYNTFRLRVSQIFLDGEPPEVDGPDVISSTWAFSGHYDLTNPPATCEYMSTDITA